MSEAPFLAGLEPGQRLKTEKLFGIISEMKAMVVAFSGGVDSALLSAAGAFVLGRRMLAITAHSPVESPGDCEAAENLARQLGFSHRVVAFNDLDNPQFVQNPPDRCYHCKLARFRQIARLAKEFHPDAVVVEGSNADDSLDYRPGMRAVVELGIRSPLVEAGFRKPEIRALAKAMNLSVWDRPSAPCLATRFPYGRSITAQGLEQVARGEAFLQQNGFTPARVRHFGDTARLEVAPEMIGKLFAMREEALEHFKAVGFTYVVVDLAGYRMGSMNEVLKP